MKYLNFTILVCLFPLAITAQDIQTFLLKNDTGMKAVVSNYGARLMQLEVHNWNGRLEPVIKGYQHISEYKDNPTLGATMMSLDGKVSQTKTDENGQKVKIPFTHKDALEFICDQATYALMEMDLLKGRFEMLISNQEDKSESVDLPVLDLGGAQ